MLVNRNKRVTINNSHSKKPDETDKSDEKSHKSQQIRKNVMRIGVLFMIGVILFYTSNKNNNARVVRRIEPKHQPSLIIVASINGGTSTFNRILMHNFKHFFHGFRATQDMLYWKACIPKDFRTKIVSMPRAENYKFPQLFNTVKAKKNAAVTSWDATFNNLQFFGCHDIGNKYHCNLKCTHDDYMQHIGFDANGYSKYKDIFFENALNRSSDKIHYFYDRSSAYNSLPHIPMVLATNYPHSKLLYIVRDPLTQIYSRFRNFDEMTSLQKEKKELLSHEANRRFEDLLNFVQSEPFSKVLIPLLSKEATGDVTEEQIENDIIIWYQTLWFKERRVVKGMFAFQEKRLFDICPYVNILLFVKSVRIGLNSNLRNFKVVQFEWATDSKLIFASIYIYCWTVYNEYEYGNNCVGKYTQNQFENLDEIMFDWRILEKNAKFGKLKDYEWNLTDLTVFDELIQFFELCDLKLVQLIEKYPIILGGFDLKLWTQRRKEIRQKMLDKQ